MSPYADWGPESNRNTVTRWTEAVLAVPCYTEEVGQRVVDALLQIASNIYIQPYIPVNIWAWLKKRPSLPPVCSGRKMGTWHHVIPRVRQLGDIEILESYLLLVWSEWNVAYQGGFIEMCTSIREDLGGIGMGCHREVLINRLDYVLGQLDRGLEHLKQRNPLLGEDHIPEARIQYEGLREVLLEVGREASEILTRTPFRLINLFNLLTSADVHRVSLDVHLCASSPVPVVAHSRHLVSPRHPFKLRRFDPRRRRARDGVLYMSLLSSSYYPVYHNLPLCTFIPVSSSHPSPHSSRFSLNGGRTSMLPLVCEVPSSSTTKSGGGNSIGSSPEWYLNRLVEWLIVRSAFSLWLRAVMVVRPATGG